MTWLRINRHAHDMCLFATCGGLYLERVFRCPQTVSSKRLRLLAEATSSDVKESLRQIEALSAWFRSATDSAQQSDQAFRKRLTVVLLLVEITPQTSCTFR